MAAIEAIPNGDEVPAGFDESAEAAFLGEAGEQGTSAAPTLAGATGAREEAAAEGALPPLDELVGRIPPEVREALDDLFRAKFTTVRRVPPKALKS